MLFPFWEQLVLYLYHFRIQFLLIVKNAPKLSPQQDLDGLALVDRRKNNI